jgi:Na+(H+)/acetate symporter ActP
MLFRVNITYSVDIKYHSHCQYRICYFYISQLVTEEIIYPANPKATPERMACYGRLTSVVSVFLAMLIGIFWDERISDLGKIQFSITTQAVPAFLFGLYSQNEKMGVYPWCIAMGTWAAVIFIFATHYMYLKLNADYVSILQRWSRLGRWRPAMYICPLPLLSLLRTRGSRLSKSNSA